MSIEKIACDNGWPRVIKKEVHPGDESEFLGYLVDLKYDPAVGWSGLVMDDYGDMLMASYEYIRILRPADCAENDKIVKPEPEKPNFSMPGMA